ncbi:MAG: glycosyltransferase [Campylobacterales bacterium]|nr:glycosyltransferase [Campylobacterales bacterium]
MKKKLLFIINNLNCGGAEKALISLLENINYKYYDVDLLLFKHEGIFLNKVPKGVNLLSEPPNYKYYDMPFIDVIQKTLRERKVKILLWRVLAGFVFRSKKNASIREQESWKYISKSLEPLEKEYDAAIGYLEKNPIYYCVEKVNAKVKIGFIHNDYIKLGMDKKIDEKYFQSLSNIVTVSEGCVDVLKETFPIYKEKVELMFNIVSPATIKKMALEHNDIKARKTVMNITSVGRLTFQKGFDLAIDACKLLINRGYNVTWNVIGEGEERENLEKLIEKHGLQKEFKLIGLKENPYPYINASDIYVQPSRYEGRCLTITEAKILNKPIVATNFKVVYDQLENLKNSLIVEQDPESIANGIEKLIIDPLLIIEFKKNLSKENYNNEMEIEKFYKLVN